MAAVTETVRTVEALGERYAHGFVTDIEQEFAPKGLSEDIVRFISAKKNEPAWMLELRLEAYQRWRAMDEPDWAKLDFPRIDYEDLYYWAAPKERVGPKSLDEVDPELLRTYEKLGIPLREQAVLAGVEGAPRVAVDAVFDSVSVATTFKRGAGQGGRAVHADQRGAAGASRAGAATTSVPSCPCLGQLLRLPELGGLLRRFLRLHPAGRALPDGAFSTYFRINAENTGQFERTLIIADKGQLRQLSRRLHRSPCATRTSCTPR